MHLVKHDFPPNLFDLHSQFGVITSVEVEGRVYVDGFAPDNNGIDFSRILLYAKESIDDIFTAGFQRVLYTSWS